jgi:hypothetical protein
MCVLPLDPLPHPSRPKATSKAEATNELRHSIPRKFLIATLLLLLIQGEVMRPKTAISGFDLPPLGCGRRIRASERQVYSILVDSAAMTGNGIAP